MVISACTRDGVQSPRRTGGGLGVASQVPTLPPVTDSMSAVSAFQSWIVRRKRGQVKRWFDFPVVLYAWHVSEIVGAFGGTVRIVVNGEHTIHVSMVSLERDRWALDALFHDERHHPVTSIAVHGPQSGVYLGPNTLYGYSNVKRSHELATLARIEDILRRARRPLGTFLTRTWGSAIAVATAFISGVAVFRESSPESRTAILAIVLALAVYLLATITVTLRRVIFRLTISRVNSGFWRRNQDSVLTGVLISVLSALILAALASLGGLFELPR